MSLADMSRRLDQLERQLASLRQQTPVRIGPTTATTINPIIIIGGQSLGNLGGITTYGITRYSGILSGITTQTYDPGTVNATTGAETGGPSPAITAWPDGLGYGTLWNGTTFERVIVVNDDNGPLSTALIGGASDDATYAPSYRQCRTLSTRTASVTLADLTTITAYIPDLG